MDCLNPACSNPFNPNNHSFCSSCGVPLNLPYLFQNQYRVTRLLGEGAFGRTYLAEDTKCLNRPCVIKKFIAEAQGAALAKATELFIQEAQRLYELDNPQIPRLYASFEDNNSLYLVQQYIAGENLFDEYLKRRSFAEEQVRELLQSLLPVLQYIHEKGVLHRDIKPENIMRKTDGGGASKFVLIDFGGAKQITGTIQATPGTRIFTLGYAAIEQAMGQPVKASDIYSLGATCARLLTGIFPIPQSDGTMRDDLFDAATQCWRWREQLQQQSRTASDRLEEVLDTMLQPFARDRYQSAIEALEALETVTPTISVGSSQKTTIAPAPNLQSFSFEVITVHNWGKIKNRCFDLANYFIEKLGRGIQLEMVAIPGGSFLMGSPKTGGWWGNYESPQHQVTIQPFYMGKYAVTQAQWKAVAALPKVKIDLKPDPSYFQGANRPVEEVSWWEAEEFCKRLSEKTKREYRLPNEAEWEYACRAGTTTAFYFGETITPKLVNYDGNYPYSNAPKGKYRKKTVEVGSLPPNRFGLFEMHGNVWEWCADHWYKNYQGAPNNSATWLSKNIGSHRLRRGGSWNFNSESCRSANRSGLPPDSSSNSIGFRVAFSA